LLVFTAVGSLPGMADDRETPTRASPMTMATGAGDHRTSRYPAAGRRRILPDDPLREQGRLEDCLMAHRSNCAPLDTSRNSAKISCFPVWRVVCECPRSARRIGYFGREDLHDEDFGRSKVQAEALRARAGSNRSLDWENLAEEIEDLGNSQGRPFTVNSAASSSMLKLEYSPATEPRRRPDI
jgi:hypothetical protein